jgi:hypothetical protein
MANKKISELTALTTPAAADDFVVRDDSEASVEKTKKIAFSALQTGILSHATELPVTIGGAVQVNFLDGEILPETDDDVNLGDATHQFKRLYLEGGITINSINQGEDVTAALNRAIIEIGDWDMDTDSSVSVSHGLTLDKIRAVYGTVRDDNNQYRLPFSFAVIGSGLSQISCYVLNTSVILQRSTSGWFDSTSYNSTSYNRGWIIIDYVN